MKLAFCLFYYFPYGGQQRDFLKIAEICAQRGHSIHVFVMDLNGELPPDFKVTVLPGRGWSNHRRCLDFSRQVRERVVGEGFDAVIGFSKIAGLDVYYAADPCYREKVYTRRSLWSRMGGRYRTYAALEEAVFSPLSHAQILLISEAEKPHFIKHYGTQEARFHLLPPGISRDCLATEDAADVRAAMRAELGLAESDFMLLMVGSAFRTKGLDRTLRAVAALPDVVRERVRLFVVGQDKQGPFLRLAKRLSLHRQVIFTGGRPDVPRFLLAADLLVHPAYNENTGTVLVEALAAGLPVLASSVCGYAHHIDSAHAGRLIPTPFSQDTMNGLLAEMLTSPERPAWQNNARTYARSNDLYSLHEKAAELIESVAQRVPHA